MSRFTSLSSLLRHRNFKQIRFPEDGNSLYKAISQAYYKDQEFHLHLRRLVVDTIQQNTDYTSQLPLPSQMYPIVREHRQKNHWCSTIEPIMTSAVSQFLNIHLTIYFQNGDETIEKKVINTPYSGQSIWIFQRKTQFDLLLKD